MRVSGADVKLEGTLDTFPLRELIEMTVYSSVTGVLTIYGASAVGRVFFRDGRPYHASYGDERGEQAVVCLFEERQGAFSFVADTASDEATLWYDPLDLIEQCEQQAQRWAQVRSAIPDMRLVPQLLNVPEGNHITLDTDHWPVFSAIDGARSVGEIVALLDTNALEVCEALASLQRAGLLQLAAGTPLIRQNVAEQEGVRTHTSLFDRLLATMPVPPSATAQPPAATAPDEDPILRMLRG